MCARSINAVLRPDFARAEARGVPDWPDPRTTQLNFLTGVSVAIVLRNEAVGEGETRCGWRVKRGRERNIRKAAHDYIPYLLKKLVSTFCTYLL
jgi:hypothetical protein